MSAEQKPWISECIKHEIEPLKFETHKYKTDEKEFIIHFFEIHEITPSLKNYIDSKICGIAKGIQRAVTLQKVKKEILTFIERKYQNSSIENSTTAIGAIAEFFIHLFLSLQEYKQECLYLNLEENSIKKGFDGVYSKADEIWIMESKSGLSTTNNISHQGKLSDAYTDLKAKLMGESQNDPWENAYHHAMCARSDQDIVNFIEQAISNADKNDYKPMSEYNLMPSATIFYDGKCKTFDKTNIEKKIIEKINTFESKQIHFICVSKKSLDLFINYLKG